LKAFMRGSYEGSLNAPKLKMVDTDCVREVARKLLPQLADAGNCVIVGRGSVYYLGNRADAFHVFVYAPFHERVRRLRLTGKSEPKAVEEAGTVDRDRAAFVKQYFDIEWPERHRFHLMVNSVMGDEMAVDVILDAVARYEKTRS
jgi:cytidylate kinase